MITSTSNQQVRQLIQFNKKRKLRDEQGVFVAEGLKMFQEAPRERLKKVYFSESCFLQLKDASALQSLNYEVMEDRVFQAVSDTQTPQGVLCVVQRRDWSLKELLDTESPMLLLLENLQDPGNLGTILRTAEGAGASGVILTKGCVDLYNPKTIRSTMGSVYRVPTYYTEDAMQTLDELHRHGIRSYAAHLQGKNSYDEEKYCGGTVFLIGNEGNGLSEELSGKAQTRIRIPMEGKLESLNAGVAASLLMYETYRQRRNNKSIL